jgi:hypothetical protein
MLILWLNAAADQSSHIVYAVAFSWSFENAGKARRGSLYLVRRFWKQEGEFQEEKAKVKLPNHWASELGSIRGNMPKWRAPRKCGRNWEYWFISKWWFISSQSKPICMQEKNIIASAYFWIKCCVLLATRVCKSAYFIASINIVYFTFNLNLIYTLMQYY